MGTVGTPSTYRGFQNYSLKWIAPDVSSKIQFALLTSGSGHYWDVDTVSIRDSSNFEKLVNGDFNYGTITGWTESCLNGCSSIEPYGPFGSPDYWSNCSARFPTYQVLSQNFTSVACMRYTVSFQISLYYGSNTGTAALFVYMN